MEEQNEQFVNDFSTENLGISEKKNKLPINNIIIIGGIALSVVIIVALILIIILTRKHSSSSSQEWENLPVIGTISCMYDVSPEVRPTTILGQEFVKKSKFDIFINGNRIKYDKVYEFTIFGSTKIEFKLHENINMDYMFKGVDSLITVEMSSENNNNTKILSMISTFENCVNLKSFSIKGFNTR